MQIHKQSPIHWHTHRMSTCLHVANACMTAPLKMHLLPYTEYTHTRTNDLPLISQLFLISGSYSSKRASFNIFQIFALVFLLSLCLVISRDVERLLILMERSGASWRSADGLFAWTVLPRLRGDDGQREVVSQSWPVLPVLTGVNVSLSPCLWPSCMEMHMSNSCGGFCVYVYSNGRWRWWDYSLREEVPEHPPLFSVSLSVQKFLRVYLYNLVNQYVSYILLWKVKV